MNDKIAISALLCVAIPCVVLYRCAQVRSLQGTIEKSSLLHEAMDSIEQGTPLELPPCYETTPVVSLKNKGIELRRRYNIRYNLCLELRKHLQELCACGYVSQYTYKKLVERIKKIETGNEELKKQFIEITAYLEAHHAQSLKGSYEEEDAETLRALERQNEELLRHVPMPHSVE